MAFPLTDGLIAPKRILVSLSGVTGPLYYGTVSTMFYVCNLAHVRFGKQIASELLTLTLPFVRATSAAEQPGALPI